MLSEMLWVCLVLAVFAAYLLNLRRRRRRLMELYTREVSLALLSAKSKDSIVERGGVRES